MQKSVFSVLILLFILPSFQLAAEPNPTEQEKFLRANGVDLSRDEMRVSALPDDPKKLESPIKSKFPDTLYYNFPYSGGLLGSVTIPINFSLFSWDPATQNLSSEPNMSIGVGYAFIVGDFAFKEDKRIEINPVLLFGPAINVGLSQGTSTQLNVLIGGFIGFPGVSLYGGWEFITRRIVIGLGTRIDVLTVESNLFHVLGPEVVPLYGKVPKDAKEIE